MATPPEFAEVQPLLERRDSTLGREQFQAARNEAVQNGVSGVAIRMFWLSVIFMLVFLFAIGFLIYVEIRSWYTLIVYVSLPCDQPLWYWLLFRVLLGPVTSPLRPRSDPRESWGAWIADKFRSCHLVAQLTWIGLGFHWTSACETCQQTNPELFHWVRFLTMLAIVLILVSCSLVLLIYLGSALFVQLVRLGWIRNPKAADEGTLDSLEVVAYAPGMFADDAPGNIGDNRPPGECCCCMERFSDQKEIVKTPCMHYFHKECMGEWLKLAKTCPLCRTDLEAHHTQAAEAAAVPPGNANIAADAAGSSDAV